MIRNQKLWILAVLTFLTGAYLLAPPIRGQEAKEPATKSEKAARPMMQCPMMTNLGGLKMFADSPALLVFQADELGLTEEQKKQLEDIEKSAREKGRNVLTPEQQEKLKAAPEGPLSMMDLCMLRMKKMTQQEKGGPMCPMCMRMMQGKSDQSKATDRKQ
jgi:hypothetical protein